MHKGKKNIKILVVDNDKDLRSIVASILVERGFIVEEAEDGEDALSKVSKNRPDVILLDVMMPGLDGFETCKRLKEDKKTREIAVIFCTSVDKREIIKKNIDFDDYIEKPFLIQDLYEKIDKLLKK